MEARLLLPSGRERFELDCPYYPRFLSAMKACVPARYRRWNPSSYRWEISRSYFEEVKKLAREHFEYVSESLI